MIATPASKLPYARSNKNIITGLLRWYDIEKYIFSKTKIVNRLFIWCFTDNYVFWHFVFRSRTMSSSRSSGKEPSEPFIRQGISTPMLRYGTVTCDALKCKSASCSWRVKQKSTLPVPVPVNSFITPRTQNTKRDSSKTKKKILSNPPCLILKGNSKVQFNRVILKCNSKM